MAIGQRREFYAASDAKWYYAPAWWYLDLAEDRAERHIPMTMEDWAKRLDLFLMADDREVLQDAGKITAEIAKAKAETEFEKYRVIQDRLFMSDFDKYMLELEENAKK